jgi:small GTP-binding protein
MKTIQKKICLLGDFAVGKTSLVRQFVEGRFDDKYLSTIGVKVSRRSLQRPYGTLNLLLWDLAGSEEFKETSYLQGTAGAFIVCDLTRRETLATLKNYASYLYQISQGVPLVFIGNKMDLSDEWAIKESELQNVAASFGSPYFLTSAKTGAHVETAFHLLAEKLENPL